MLGSGLYFLPQLMKKYPFFRIITSVAAVSFIVKNAA